jgi:hypothetical protein
MEAKYKAPAHSVDTAIAVISALEQAYKIADQSDDRETMRVLGDALYRMSLLLDSRTA